MLASPAGVTREAAAVVSAQRALLLLREPGASGSGAHVLLRQFADQRNLGDPVPAVLPPVRVRRFRGRGVNGNVRNETRRFEFPFFRFLTLDSNSVYKYNCMTDDTSSFHTNSVFMQLAAVPSRHLYPGLSYHCLLYTSPSPRDS